MQVTFKDALDLFKASTERVDTLWHFYVLVALGVLGFVIGNQTIRDSREARLRLTYAFLFFALVNAVALFSAQKHHYAVAKAIGKMVPDSSPAPVAPTAQSASAKPDSSSDIIAVVRALPVSTPLEVVVFQIGLDLIIAVLIIGPRWRPRVPRKPSSER